MVSAPISRAWVPSQTRCDWMRVSSLKQDAEILGALGDFEAEELLDGEAVAEIVRHRGEIVDAVGEGNDLLVELGFAGLLDAGVEVADVWGAGQRRLRHRFRAPGGGRRGSTGCCGPMLRTMVWSLTLPVLCARASARMSFDAGVLGGVAGERGVEEFVLFLRDGSNGSH